MQKIALSRRSSKTCKLLMQRQTMLQKSELKEPDTNNDQTTDDKLDKKTKLF